MSEDWFNWYVQQTIQQKDWPKFRDRFLCPCCYMPTLTERAQYQICVICFWEDDGQDSDDAELVFGGPNADYSLQEARENFNDFHTMYRRADAEHFARELTKKAIKITIYNAMQLALKSGDDKSWAQAVELQQRYYAD